MIHAMWFLAIMICQKKLDAHFNFECLGTIEAIMYIYKFIYNSYDMMEAVLEIGDSPQKPTGD